MIETRSDLRSAALALVALTVFTLGGGWLGLSYLGVISTDVKVAATLPTLGDSLGPNSKVRYHGIIVGRVLTVSEARDGYRANLLIKASHAEQIPPDATARILPSTLFGSEYVELVAERDATDDHLASGDVLVADTSREAVRLMDSFDTAERLISAVDVEQIDRAVSTMGAALDGHGDDLAAFLHRSDRYVTTLNGDADLAYENLGLAADALDVVADVEPDLVASLEHARTPARTLVEKDAVVGEVLGSSVVLSGHVRELLDLHGDDLVTLNDRTAPLSAMLAKHRDAARLVMQRAPKVLHNGANGVDENAIQMEGMIGLDPMDPYTADDCHRYGTWTGSNCGNDVPTSSSGGGGQQSDADLAALAEQVEGLVDELREVPGAPAPEPSASDPSSPSPADPNLIDGLVDGVVDGVSGLLEELGRTLTGGGR
jgi:phospholipid/cholesterol/gamma-HCH transport system substrate-binding protein